MVNAPICGPKDRVEKALTPAFCSGTMMIEGGPAIITIDRFNLFWGHATAPSGHGMSVSLGDITTTTMFWLFDLKQSSL